MAKVEEHLKIVTKNEYRDDLEEEVAFHTTRVLATKPFKVNRKYTHIEIPEFDKADRKGRLDFEMREIDRCVNGYDGMTGNYYFLFNHTHIKDKARGRIRPDFRTTQMQFAALVDRIYKTPGRGLVNVKRRQIGMSWNFAIDNIYRCTFNNNFDIGMNSKSLLDGQQLFYKHKYIHRGCTPFLRAFVNTDRRDAMVFHKWIKSEQRWKGTGSSIVSVAPTPTGHAGSAYRALSIDEAGEQLDLMPLWSNAEECLMSPSGFRIGTPFIFGTMGDTFTAGKGLQEFWKNAEAYNLERSFLAGFNCAILDPFGNDNIEESIRSIIYERKSREGLSKVIYAKYRQKWPIVIEDAFLVAGGSGIGNPITLSKHYNKLINNPPVTHKGRMSPNPSGGVDFIADELNGKIIIYERPELLANGYVAACDPAEDDGLEKSRDTSNISTAILAKPFGLLPPRLVAEYADRPPFLADYYEQLALLLQWYNNTPVLVEMNRGGWRLNDYFKPRWPKLLALAPKSFNSIKTGFDMKEGIKMNPERKSQMFGLGDAYVENHCDSIPSLRLIEEFKMFGGDHATDDLATAFLWALISLQSDRRIATAIDAESAKNPTFHYQRVGRGMQLVGRDGAALAPQIKTNNPLFNRR